MKCDYCDMEAIAEYDIPHLSGTINVCVRHDQSARKLQKEKTEQNREITIRIYEEGAMKEEQIHYLEPEKSISSLGHKIHEIFVSNEINLNED